MSDYLMTNEYIIMMLNQIKDDLNDLKKDMNKTKLLKVSMKAMDLACKQYREIARVKLNIDANKAQIDYYKEPKLIVDRAAFESYDKFIKGLNSLSGKGAFILIMEHGQVDEVIKIKGYVGKNDKE